MLSSLFFIYEFLYICQKFIIKVNKSLSMKRKHLKITYVSCLALLLGLIGCTTNDYDLDDNVDMTMGIGAKGLTLKFGSTEPIYLRDLLKVADSDILDTLKSGDDKCLYYIEKDGSVNTDINVATPDPIKINEVSFNFNANVPIGAKIPAGVELPLNISGTTQSLKFDVKNIEESVKQVVSVVPEKINLVCTLGTNLDGAKVVPNGAKIKFPAFVRSSKLDADNCLVIKEGENTFSITIDSLFFNPSLAPKNKTLSIDENVEILGNLKLKAERDIPITPEMNITASLDLNFNTIKIVAVSGKIEKSINAKSEEINIKKDIPDFLKEEDVRVYVENPTVRISSKIDKDGWPLPIDFSANIKTKRDNEIKKNISIPSKNYVVIPANKDYTCYFYAGQKPFETEESIVGDKYVIPELSDLFYVIPDAFVADVSGDHVKINQDKIHRINVGKEYSLSINYKLSVPLEFKENTMIVYSDSVVDLNKDIKDYSVDSLKITASAINSVPLNLVAEAFAYDLYGNKIEEIVITKDEIKAANADGTPKTTDIKLKINSSNSEAFKKMEKIVFRVSCLANGSGKLKSSQYLQIKDLRFVLQSQIIGDFN